MNKTKEKETQRPLVITEAEYETFMPKKLEYFIFTLLTVIVALPVILLLLFGWDFVIGMTFLICASFTMGTWLTFVFIQERIYIADTIVTESD